MVNSTTNQNQSHWHHHSYGSVGIMNYDDNTNKAYDNDGGERLPNESSADHEHEHDDLEAIRNKRKKTFLIQSSITTVCMVSLLVFFLSFESSSSPPLSSSSSSSVRPLDSKSSSPPIMPKDEEWIGEDSMLDDFIAVLLPYEEELVDLVDPNVNSNADPSTISNENEYENQNNDNNNNQGRDDEIQPAEQVALLRDHAGAAPAFSTLDPVTDLKVLPYDRPKFSTPQKVFGKKLHLGQSKTGYPLPTNSWYENMLLISDEQTEADLDNRIYTVPYVINTAGPIPGIKLGSTRVLGMDKVVQITYIDQHGLTVGAAQSFDNSSDGTFGNAVQKRFEVFDEDIGNEEYYSSDYNGEEPIKNHSPLTPLGLTIKWNPENKSDTSSSFKIMSSSLVRGMPYGTMHYKYNATDGNFTSILPTVVSQIKLYSPPLVDLKNELICTKERNAASEQLVTKSVRFTFLESDATWLVFYSHPVYVKCYDLTSDETATPFVLQATRLANSDDTDEAMSFFTSRVALMNNCTLGANPSHCRNGKPSNKTDYSMLLHKHADVYPGRNTKIDYTFFSDDVKGGGSYSFLQYDWDAHHVRTGKFTAENGIDKAGLLMYSLPHHRETLYKQFLSKNTFHFDGSKTYCTPGLNGDACIVDGAIWVLKESLAGEPSFFAPRPPLPSTLHKLSNAIMQDIHYKLPGYYTRGAGDTYFSGKMLAKLSRILLITHELKTICSRPKKIARRYGEEYIHACESLKLPSRLQFRKALDHLRSSTEIWINGTAETPFVYDNKWGGMCSCGCLFNGTSMNCDNRYPNCPAFSDPGLDFGHAFYNDHHFHQGYHIYAAATIAYFDKAWGSKMFENVLLLIRDIANPSTLDEFFPVTRMKDWYLGNSWAGGMARAYPNGRNQESSSESIAAYEAISMFGKVMADNFGAIQTIENQAKASVARHIRDVGRLLTATELRSADRYWHVRQTGPKSGIYPPEYKPLVVGIMWNMMAQFQTWFGNAPHLAYGIQLLPLTPVSERRDALDWVKQLYPSFAESCSTAPDCKSQGWGILQHAVLAEVGYPHLAIEYAEALPKSAYTSAGGNGHSLTNSIWYYATRPKTEPIALPNIPTPPPVASPSKASHSHSNDENATSFDCGCPETCTAKVQGYAAGGFSCGARITWLMKTVKKSEVDACSLVAGVQFTDVCAGCDPNRCTAPRVTPVEESHICPACSKTECEDNTLNRCPLPDAPFLCTDGVNRGGCSMVPWILGTDGGSNCNKCCQLTYNCQ